MRRGYVICALFLFLLQMPQAHALSEETDYTISTDTVVTESFDLGSGVITEPTRTLADNISQYVDVPDGATDWRVLGKTKETTVNDKTEDGHDWQYFKPAFTPEVEALNGKEITIKGFMFPLESTEAQKLFLFGPFPVSCPFQYHVGPSLVLEVHADQHPVVFDYDAIVLKGRLELVAEDKENGVFYRLVDARQVKK